MVDLESLVPERCKDCDVAKILVRKKLGLISTCALIIDAEFNEEPEADLSSILLRTTWVEEEAVADVKRLIKRCEDTTEFFPEPGELGDTFYCRMPPSGWLEIL